MYDIDDFDAAAIAAQWHSVMTWNDPGVAMYSVTSTGKVHSEEHRANLLSYIDGCIAQAVKLDAAGVPPTLTEMFDSNETELDALREWATNYKIGKSE